MADSVKIAVRVRPFNQREKDLNSSLIIDMDGPTTLIKNPNDSTDVRRFTFDYSYWSYDGFETQTNGVNTPVPGSRYADQSRVFDDLGRTVINNAKAGYNTTLMAYGQTGAGKSFSMFGYPPNLGIVPKICSELFTTIEESTKQNPTLQCRMTFSMLEIYQDKVHDLLNAKSGDLKTRYNPKIGFYVEGLSALPVQSYNEIEILADKGTKNRTVAATKMNNTSSRSHTILIITFIQINKSDNSEKRSIINLVDLAGSERTNEAGTTGVRLKEGVNINSSLSVLGNCIAAIIAKQNGKKKIVVPFRDSTLTKLLANSLGGNSKTIMIAAISPGDVNYEETLSTLRFMDRAKAIKTKAVVNENPIDKLIRELREENERLKSILEKNGGVMPVLSDNSSESNVTVNGDDEEDAAERLRQQIKEQEIALNELNKTWQQRLDETKSSLDQNVKERIEQEKMKKTTPYLKNVHEDAVLSGKILYFITPGQHTIGRKSDGSTAHIQLSGLSILQTHALINFSQNTVFIQALDQAKVYVNGIQLKPYANATILNHNDRVLLGTQHLFLLKMPNESNKNDEINDPTWNFAQAEIAKASGFRIDDATSAGMQLLYADITELLPAIREANAIAEEFEKPKRFEMMIRMESALAMRTNDKVVEDFVYIKVNDFDRHIKWIWTKSRFLNARLLMQEMYSAWVEKSNDPLLLKLWPKEKDPFATDPEDWMIGTGVIPLKTLGYLIDIKDTTVLISDVKGANEGILRVGVSMKVMGVDTVDTAKFSTDPKLLIGKDLQFTVKIHGAIGLRWTKGPLYCTYSFWEADLPNKNENPKVPLVVSPTLSNREELNYISPISHSRDPVKTHRTKVVPNSNNPEFNDECSFTVKCTDKHIDYLLSDSLKIDVWGVHDEEVVQKTYQRTRPPSRTESANDIPTGKPVSNPVVKRAASASLLSEKNATIETTNFTEILSAANSSTTTQEFLEKIREILKKASTKEELDEMKVTVKTELAKVQKREKKAKKKNQEEENQKQIQHQKELEEAKREIARQATLIIDLQNGLKEAKSQIHDTGQKESENLQKIRDILSSEIEKEFSKFGAMSLPNSNSSKSRLSQLQIVPEASFNAPPTVALQNSLQNAETKEILSKMRNDQTKRINKLQETLKSVQTPQELSSFSGVISKELEEMRKVLEITENTLQQSKNPLEKGAITFVSKEGKSEIQSVEKIQQIVQENSGKQLDEKTKNLIKSLISDEVSREINRIINDGSKAPDADKALKQLQVLNLTKNTHATLEEQSLSISEILPKILNAVNKGQLTAEESEKLQSILSSLDTQAIFIEKNIQSIPLDQDKPNVAESKTNALVDTQSQLEKQKLQIEELKKMVETASKRKSGSTDALSKKNIVGESGSKNLELLRTSLMSHLKKAEDSISRSRIREGQLLISVSEGLVKVAELTERMEKMTKNQSRPTTSELLNRPRTAGLLDDSIFTELEKEFGKRERELEKRTQKTVNLTLNALTSAEDHMRVHKKKMDQLQKILHDNLAKSAALEETSKNTSSEIKKLRDEIDRLNSIKEQRDKDHLNQFNYLTAQIVEKSKALAAEIVTGTELKNELELLKEKLKMEVAEKESLQKDLKAIRATEPVGMASIAKTSKVHPEVSENETKSVKKGGCLVM